MVCSAGGALAGILPGLDCRDGPLSPPSCSGLTCPSAQESETFPSSDDRLASKGGLHTRRPAALPPPLPARRPARPRRPLEGMRSAHTGYVRFSSRPFFSPEALTCGFARRTSRQTVHTWYAHRTYPPEPPGPPPCGVLQSKVLSSGAGRMKKGRRPIAPPRLICTLESPVSSTSRSDNCDSMFGPAP